MNHSRYPPEGSNTREPKVAIPRIPGQNYQIPPATRTPRARSEVVSKARLNALVLVRDVTIVTSTTIVVTTI